MQKLKAVNIVIYLLIVILISSCAGTRATGNEVWTLVELVTQGEDVQSVTDTVEVRNCCNLVENKTVSCSAGTSNDLSVDIGGSFGGQGISFDPSIGATLGFNRNSGESLELPTPPSGYIYQYKVTTTYSIIAGEAIVRSSNGQEKQTSYRFQAKCSLKIEPDRESIACNESCSSQPSQPSSQPPTVAPAIQNNTDSWSKGNLIYDEDFEDGIANGIETIFGRFGITETDNGNHVWRTESSSLGQISLPTTSNDYALEAKIMQISDKQGFGFVEIRKEKGNPCDAGYGVYLDLYGDWLNLIERDQSCEELRQSGLFANRKISLSNGVWYTIRIEAKGAEVRVYLNEELVAQDTDTDGTIRKSSIIDVATCCGDLEPFVFDFDDIKAWLLNP
jgi:hypothetical protein